MVSRFLKIADKFSAQVEQREVLGRLDTEELRQAFLVRY